MAKKKTESADVLVAAAAIDAPNAPSEPSETWTDEELLAVRHLGPGIIGEAKWKAAQLVATTTNNGMFGPALISDDPKYNQAAPTRAAQA